MTTTKDHPWEPRERAEHNGWVLLASCELPNDPHLAATICYLPDNGITPFVTWLFNKESGGFFDGHYYPENQLLDCVLSYIKRAIRYDGDPTGHLLLQSEKLEVYEAMDKLLKMLRRLGA